MLGTRRQTIRFPISPAESLVVNDLYFPLASAPAAFWAVVRPDGGDIRVTTQDGITQCAREIVNFDPVNKCGSVWFAANSGSAFYLCAGSGQDEPAADATIGRLNAWEADMKGVYHCNDAATPLSDSTENANHAVVEGTLTYRQEGRSGFCVYGDAAGKAAATGDVLTGDNYSMSCWVKRNDVDTIYFMSRGYGAGYDTLGCYTGKWFVFNGVTNLSFGPAVTPNVWNHVVFTRAGTDAKLYINGALSVEGVLPITYTTGKIVIMGRPDALIGRAWHGWGDEYRFLDRTLGAPEISQRYAIQNNPAAFWTVGAAG